MGYGVKMDTRTGMIIPNDVLEQIPVVQQKHFTTVMRDLSKLEEAQMEIKLWSPCGCGSGKKFKFCCFKPVN